MIEKTFTIVKNCSTGDGERNDLLYWSLKTAGERFSAVEQLRKDFWGEDYAAKQRFPRFYKITKHSSY
jgi:hypothetical protein